MSKEEESKKTEFAKISPVKLEKAMSASEIEAHKKQLEQYYSGQKVEEIDKIIKDSQRVPIISKASKGKIIFYLLIFTFFWLGVIMSYLLDK